MRKAQVALELMVLVAFITIVLILLFDFGENKVTESASVLQVSQARNTVDRLAKAVTEVHTEGVGARRQVYVQIPDRVNSNRVIIANNSITIGVYTLNGYTDVSMLTDFPVIQGGFFPTTPGSYWVWVISREGYVQVGSALVVNPLDTYYELSPSNSSDINLTLTNFGTSPINVTASLSWTDSEVSAKINGTTSLSINLSSGTPNSQNIDVNVSANLNASRGLHSGYISVTDNLSEGEVIPVLVNIISLSSTSSGVSYLTISTYSDNAYTTSTTVFSASNAVYYIVRSYNSTDGLVNSNVTVRVYNTTSALVDERTYPPNNGTGVYIGNYTLPPSAPSGAWKLTTYEIGGANTAMYFTVS
jgi:hypothetical protein